MKAAHVDVAGAQTIAFAPSESAGADRLPYSPKEARPQIALTDRGPLAEVCGSVRTAYPLPAAPSIAFHPSGESRNFAAPIFSSRCFTEDVPGIGTKTGEW